MRASGANCCPFLIPMAAANPPQMEFANVSQVSFNTIHANDFEFYEELDHVIQREPLSMSWCLDCHRDPGKSLRPASEVTNMAWKAPEQSPPKAVAPTGREVKPPLHCSGCHR